MKHLVTSTNVDFGENIQTSSPGVIGLQLLVALYPIFIIY